jgi:hypothetical protein
MKGRRPCISHSRCVCCRHIHAPAAFGGFTALVVTHLNIATAPTKERSQENNAEYCSDEEPSSHGDLDL